MIQHRLPVSRRARRTVDPSMLGKLRQLPSYLTDPSVSLLKKLAIVLGALYIISPVDAVSDFLPIIGWMDDIGLLGLMYLFMSSELSRYSRKHHTGTSENLLAGQ
jgi:uncharacterized membrane protein YkvA (DUF1232 family)